MMGRCIMRRIDDLFFAIQVSNDPCDDVSHWIDPNAELLARDMAIFGAAFTIDGRRVDPQDFYAGVPYG